MKKKLSLLAYDISRDVLRCYFSWNSFVIKYQIKYHITSFNIILSTFHWYSCLDEGVKYCVLRTWRATREVFPTADIEHQYFIVYLNWYHLTWKSVASSSHCTKRYLKEHGRFLNTISKVPIQMEIYKPDFDFNDVHLLLSIRQRFILYLFALFH